MCHAQKACIEKKFPSIATVLLELNPRGQVAPQVYVDNCDATNETEGGKVLKSTIALDLVWGDMIINI